MKPNDPCKCGHTYKDHCKGGVWHSHYKDQMRQTATPRGDTCKSTHCDSVLCCCLNFRPKTMEMTA